MDFLIHALIVYEWRQKLAKFVGHRTQNFMKSDHMSSYENGIHNCKRDVGHDLTFIPQSLTTIP